MIYITLFLTICTLAISLIVVNFCLKYIQNLRQALSNNEIIQQRKLNSLQHYWQDYAEVREKKFMEKLIMLSQPKSDELILSEVFNPIEILTIPCYENRLNELHYSNFRKIEQLYQSGKITFHLNFMNLDIEQIEQMLTNMLVKHLIDNKFVQGKYQIRDNFAQFVCHFYKKIGTS